MISRRTVLIYTSLFFALLLATAMQFGSGSAAIFNSPHASAILELRATRWFAAFLAGAALATGGAVVQGLFRNPLASPSIIGTTAGANLGGQIALLTYQVGAFRLGSEISTIPDIILPLGCLVGAFFALVILLGVMRSGTDLLTLLLTGFILSSLFLSIGSFLTSVAQQSWELGRAMLSWTLGSLSGVASAHVWLSAPLIAISIAALWGWGRGLDMMLSGEDEAAALGVDVPQLRRWVIIWVAILTGSAVSLGGGIAFVGLVVPHLLRPFVGVEHRKLIPASAFFGGIFLIMCDAFTRMVPSHGEVPLGVVTGLIGAPLFFALLLRMHREAVDA